MSKNTVNSITTRTNLQVFRWLPARLPKPGGRRIVILTGARQTGKTTLARSLYSKLRYLNLDESYVVSEWKKWKATMAPDTQLRHYRTRSGREVDLMVRTPADILGVEIKARNRWSRRDVTGLAALADALDSEWRGGLLILRDGSLQCSDEKRNIWASPAPRWFA